MKGTCEQIPFHFFLKFMMLTYAGGPFTKNSLNLNAVGGQNAYGWRAALRVVVRAELERRRSAPYHVSGGLLHIIGDVAAVGARVGYQLGFVQLLGAVQSLLRGVAVELVRVALESRQVVELRRVGVLLLLHHGLHNGGFAAFRRGLLRLERLNFSALSPEFAAVQLQREIPCRGKLLYLLLALHQHCKGRGLDSADGKQAAVLHREKLRRVHSDDPVCLIAC